MRRLVATALLVLFPGCATTAAPAATTRTIPEPVAFSAIPDDPTHDPIPPEDDWVVEATDVEVAPGDVRSGILLSDARAARAARLRIAYDELRALYGIDLRTWERERGVYERYLLLADEEIATWRARSERSWWEENGDEVGLFVGLGIGLIISIATGAIIADIAP